jgi:hypothetical protein
VDVWSLVLEMRTAFFGYVDEQCSQCEGRPLIISLSNTGSVKAADEYGVV